MTADALLEVSGLGKRFGGFVALEAIELTVRNGERVGLIGPNGSGKSTLVNCMCGTLRHEMGSVRFAGQIARRPVRARAHTAGPRAQLPVAAPVQHAVAGREPAHPAALRGERPPRHDA